MRELNECRELTIDELEAVTGGTPMEVLNQIMQAVQKMQNPEPPPQSGPTQQFLQVLNSLQG